MSVWPAWEVQEEGGATSWFQVRLAFPDGARVDALAVVSAGCVRLEDVRAQPALSLDDLTVLADWIEEPLFEACGVDPGRTDGTDRPDGAGGVEPGDTQDLRWGDGAGDTDDAADACGTDGATGEPGAGRRARPAWPRGIEGRWLVAQEYRAAQEDGLDPVLAVMCVTGHSRRRSLRLIAQARDAGFLTPRHARR
ncbi:hypothetical protein I3F60_14800 [Streptomyces sp. MUM 136J]|uniref:DUF6214 family protein n=1 Tax=Streptomyces sp. MUM 136J TaxID=2791992 RepID=UPI0035ABB9C2|nr:hypothetical protein [Streptomyces sp. MUM 136J]